MAERAVTPATRASEQYDRVPDAGILKITSKQNVGKKEVQFELEEWLTECNLQNDFILRGPALGKFFTLAFAGVGRIAATKCKQAQDSIRRPDGSWRKFHVTSPTKSEVEIFVNEDISPKEARVQQAVKKLHRILAAADQSREYHKQRRAGTISVNWVPIAKITAPESNIPVEVRWNMEAINKFNVDKEAVMASFKVDTPSTETVEWCL